MSVLLVNKYRGELLHSLLNRVRSEYGFSDLEKLTYAGRLDPLASGLMIILSGDDVHKKPDFSGYDKTYTTEILFGFETDTYDILGIPTAVSDTDITIEKIGALLEQLIGTYDQDYPAYSSKTVDGTPMWSLARDGELPETHPSHTITVYSADILEIKKITPEKLLRDIHTLCDTVTGDFRQTEIATTWENQLKNHDREFILVRIEFAVSSGTYIRSLAHQLGQLTGTGACLYALHRTSIGDYCV